MSITHREVLDKVWLECGDGSFEALETCILAYLDASDLALVPRSDPSDEILIGAIRVYESFGKKMNGMCNARRFFIASAGAA